MSVVRLATHSAAPTTTILDDRSRGSNYDYEHDPDGFIGGAYAGYNYQFTNGVVLGGEADIVWGDR